MAGRASGGRGIKSDETLFDIVELLRETDGAGVTEVADRLDVAKSTVHGHLTTLLDRGARVGVARFGPRFELVAPDGGRHHRERVTALLTDSIDGVDGPTSPSGSAGGFEGQVDEVLERTAGNAEIVVVTPLLDDFGVDVTRRAAERGRGVATLSPDVTGDGSLGAEFVGVERRNRIEALRSTGVPVGDWRVGDPVRWSRASGGVR